jgi:hypothetical protein
VKVFHDMQCRSCAFTAEFLRERESKPTMLATCPVCEARRTFERVHTGMTFSLKGGIGSGFHSLDYARSYDNRSDLAERRGVEFFEETRGYSPTKTPPKQRTPR